MNIERILNPIHQQPEIPNDKNPSNPVKKLNGLNCSDLKQNDAKIAEIKASLNIEQTDKTKNLQQHLQKYLELKEDVVERIGLLKAKNLPKNYQAQREALYDERLDNVIIAVIPDDLWIKGNQPSESNAENQLILIKQSYFETQEKPDEIAWMIHELAHCQNFLDSKSTEAYQKNMQTFAFNDLKTEYSYPNNLVEKHAFTKQFQYLKKQGKSKENVLSMLNEHYNKEDFPFFNRLLDYVYEK